MTSNFITRGTMSEPRRTLGPQSGDREMLTRVDRLRSSKRVLESSASNYTAAVIYVTIFICLHGSDVSVAETPGLVISRVLTGAKHQNIRTSAVLQTDQTTASGEFVSPADTSPAPGPFINHRQLPFVRLDFKFAKPRVP